MKRGISTVTGALLIVIVLLAAVAAYGFLRPTAPPPAPTAATLEELANNEGSVTIYGVIDTTDFTPKIIPAFVKEYPWAQGKINYVGLSPSDISTRALSEFKAGKVQADVLVDTLGSLTAALQGGVAETYMSPMVGLMSYPNGTYDPNGQWTVGYDLPIVVIYNTKLVDPSKVPKTWQDLTDPYWNGKIVLDDPKILNVAGSLFAHLYPILGDAQWKSLMQGIAANHPVMTQSAGDSSTKVAQGEAYLGVGLINDYLAGLKLTPPANMAIAWIQPVTSLPIVTVLCKNAPHPNFAKFFIEWFASAAGQYAIAATGRIPMHPAIAGATLLAGVLPSGVAIVGVDTNNPDYYANPSKWTSMFQSIFG